MKVQYGQRRDQTCVQDFLDEVPTGEFAALTRSTIPLLAWWNASNARELAKLLKLKAPNSATFEYPVSAGCGECNGRGKSSFTDVMVEGDNYAIAVEAKHTEPLYETVTSWLDVDKPDNKKLVLRHWLKCILKRDLEPAAVGDLVYQMVHRTASARAAAGDRNAHVVHLLFGSEVVDKYVTANRAAARLLSPDGAISFSVVSVPTEPGTDHPGTAQALEARGPEAVRDALREDAGLFRFGTPVLHEI